MFLKQNNHAYIDGANLHRGVRSLGWDLDYGRFRIWLKEKYFVTHAYIFLGYVEKNIRLYTSLKCSGFILIFKKTTGGEGFKVKGNCDVDLVLRVVKDVYEENFDEAVLVSSDGDFSSLVSFLKKRNRLKKVISPYLKCSRLITEQNPALIYLFAVKDLVVVRE